MPIIVLCHETLFQSVRPDISAPEPDDGRMNPFSGPMPKQEHLGKFYLEPPNALIAVVLSVLSKEITIRNPEKRGVI